MRVKIAFGGDVCLARATSAAALQASVDTCSNLTRGHDLAIANLECCIVPDDAVPRRMAVRVSDCAHLKDMGFDVLCLANNHILDCGNESLSFAIEFLRSQAVASVGAAATRRLAGEPLVVVRNGVRIAVINATDASHYAAGRNRPGVFGLSRPALKRAVAAVRPRVDIVIVVIHADLEFTNDPAPWKVALSRWLVKSGVDLVIHHHPHTLQGIERYGNGLIAYSLGNLVFPVYGSDYMQDRPGRVEEGALLSVTIDLPPHARPRIAYEILPTRIRHDSATVEPDAIEAEGTRSRIVEFSSRLTDGRWLRQRYLRRSRLEASRMLRGAYYALRREGAAACLRYLRIHVGTSMHRNWMRGLLTFGWR